MMPDETPAPPEVPVPETPIQAEPPVVEAPVPEVPVIEAPPPVPPPPTLSLVDRLKMEYAQMVAVDPTIAKIQREIDGHHKRIAKIHNEIFLANATISAQKKWLKSEAVEVIRRATGLERIPGLVSSLSPKGTKFKDSTFGKMIAARTAARKALNRAQQQAAQPQPPPPPEST